MTVTQAAVVFFLHNVLCCTLTAGYTFEAINVGGVNNHSVYSSTETMWKLHLPVSFCVTVSIA